MPELAKSPSNFVLRCLSGLALGPIVLAVASTGGRPAAVLASLVAALAAHEWVRLSAPGQETRAAAVAAALAVLVSIFVPILGYPLALAMAAGVWHLQRLPALSGLGVAYAGIFGVALANLAALDGGALLWLLAVVWMSDIGAYAIGRLVGGPKLAPTVSPGKTWSGMAGAILGGAMAGGIAIWLGANILAPGIALSLGGALGALGQCGDLLESALKRHAGVKDSGTLIPGHGGMLDRVDALMVAAPVLAFLLTL